MKNLIILFAVLFSFSAYAHEKTEVETQSYLKIEKSVIEKVNQSSSEMAIFFNKVCWTSSGTVNCSGGGGSAFAGSCHENIWDAQMEVMEMAGLICDGGAYSTEHTVYIQS